MAEGIFQDAALTIPATEMQVTQNADGSTPPVDFQFWLGCDDAGYKLQANSQPGIDAITVSVTDTTPGSGHEATEVKLATSQAGLDAATPGASLSLAATILGGVANAATFWARVDDATGVVAEVGELGLITNELRKVVV